VSECVLMQMDLLVLVSVSFLQSEVMMMMMIIIAIDEAENSSRR